MTQEELQRQLDEAHAKLAAKEAEIESLKSDSKTASVDEGDKRKVTMVSGLIRRDPQTEYPFEVADYEVVILRQIHGEESVTVNEDSEKQIEAPAASYREVWDQLVRKYERKNEENPVLLAYRGQPQLLAEAMGEKVSKRGRPPKA